MTAKNTFVLSLTIDRASEDEFGCKIVKIDGMPADMEFSPRSQMAKYGTIVVKTKKAPKVEAAPKAAPKAATKMTQDTLYRPPEKLDPGFVTNEAAVQALLATPGITNMLQQLMAAQGGATLAPVETPTLQQARRGRPSSKK